MGEPMTEEDLHWSLRPYLGPSRPCVLYGCDRPAVYEHERGPGFVVHYCADILFTLIARHAALATELHMRQNPALRAELQAATA